MPKNKELKKVLVIGSGPIIIGQGAEFDYAGTQACFTLKAEGCEIVLINNNPATVMTDENMADNIYFEPLTVANIKAIIKKERPDGLLATVSGQTGLNLAIELDRQGILRKYDVRVLGTSIESMINAEDREAFRAQLGELDEPILESEIISDVSEALNFSKEIGYPLITRPAYTLGGSGGGIATNKAELEKYVISGLRLSSINQCLIEKSIAGFKEIEFEVIRDSYGTCIPICHMENIDPVGIHTGDSVVVVPSQTLTNNEIEVLREASLKIVHKLKIIGACNVQLAYNSTTKEYYFIEVNPRVSRSSALASKATGYPIAKIATKLALGYHLHELYSPFSEGTLATYEPLINHVAVKVPRWPFDKFREANRELGTQMKSTGEVLAIENNLVSAFQKGIRSLELPVDGLVLKELQSNTINDLWELVTNADDRRFFVLFELIRRGQYIEEINKVTNIDLFFLTHIKKLIDLEQNIKNITIDAVNKETLLTYKQNGFSDQWLAKAWGATETALREKRQLLRVVPSYASIGNYEKRQTYYYSTWNDQDNAIKRGTSNKNKVLVVGSGPIRIGQGVEFDYSSVHSVLALQQYGYEAILMNNNPATVSTDYEFSDRLYFEPLTVEDVLHVVEHENIEQVIVQFGGQTAINLTRGLEEAGVSLLGSTLNTIDELEDRDRFYKLMDKLNLSHIPGFIATNYKELLSKSADIGFPVLLRPSYVIGGQGMVVLDSIKALEDYHQSSSYEYPILIDAYFPGREIEVDVISDGKDILIPAMFEHVEKAGVHSGDSMAITPPVSLSEQERQQVVDFTTTIARNIDFIGVLNIQFVIHHDHLYVLEVNPRASRTVPAISKVTNVNIINLAVGVLIGKALADLAPQLGLLPDNPFYTIKAPVFSTIKLPGVDPKLVPEMQSTGELIALSSTVEDGFSKAMLWNDDLVTNFSKNKREIYIDDPDEGVTESLNDLSQFICINSDDLKVANRTFNEWMKTKAAYGIISMSENMQKRECALQAGLLVMSVPETVQAFSKVMNNKQAVNSINTWNKVYEKEVMK